MSSPFTRVPALVVAHHRTQRARAAALAAASSSSSSTACVAAAGCCRNVCLVDVLTIGEERCLELLAIMEKTKRALAELGDHRGHVS
jgi:hypothetical protein